MARLSRGYLERSAMGPGGQPAAAASRQKVRATLSRRLAGKGLADNETGLFIKDVMRIVSAAHGSDLQTVQWQLHLLGWRDAVTDYGTISLIQACYPDDGMSL